MLGHESSKTTEIYTHITTKGFDQIKNPAASDFFSLQHFSSDLYYKKPTTLRRTFVRCFELCDIYPQFKAHRLSNKTQITSEQLSNIQSLLGHESSKTTEIYPHIKTKGFDQIKNPLDQLDL